MSKAIGKHIIGSSDVSFASAALVSVPNTQIANRAQIVDPRVDMKAHFGIDRIMTQYAYEIPNEFGPNGERVFGALNDDRGLIRFVGGWSNFLGVKGSYPLSSASTDFVEITFYGTGLNILLANFVGAIGGSSLNVTVDGGAEGGSLLPSATYSSVIHDRNYASNVAYVVVSGLSAGLHTVKIRTALTVGINGFEILHENSSIRALPGSYVKDERKYFLASQQLLDSKPSALTGTRGGRVIVYASGGQVQQAVQPVNVSQQNLSSADHTNEEIARKYNFREFGANRADDFSTLATSTSNRFFILDDGTTTLVAQNVQTITEGGVESVYTINTNDFITITFIGTGLDVILGSDNSARTYAVDVDRNSIGNITGISDSVKKQIKVVSGLPYGTHTVKFTQSSASSGLRISSFIVYQPKKPSIPSGAVEIADYNVMADYSAVTGTTVADNNQKPSGILSKLSMREFSYVGAGWTTTGDVNAPGSTYTITNTNGEYLECVFFGTGFSTHMLADSATFDFTVTLDGALNASGVARANASNLGGGSYRSTSTTINSPCRIEFTGLAATVHKIRITKTAGTSMRFGGIDIITPIHAPKSNLFGDLQNTLPVGSQGLQDSRKIVQGASTSKYRGVAQAITSSPTTTSTSYVPCPEMSQTVASRGSWFRFSGQVQIEPGANTAQVALFVNGQQVGNESGMQAAGANYSSPVTVNHLVFLPAGVHKVDLYWKAGSAATITASAVRRTLMVEEL